MQQTTKDITEQDKKKIEQLTNENRRLEKQRLELMNAFKRQLKLIDILKKQKVAFFSKQKFFNLFYFYFSFISKHLKCFNLLKKNFVKQLNGILHNLISSYSLVCICGFICKE
jgi:hypothetical protein